MRILAIRGENLASLPRFELDLSAGPLGEAGLFAISGPTGAGKSTLLDALCLALYDTTPRLRGEGPQHILRQSAVEAWAEVDFRCDQGKRYRATWRVHRARKKPDGKWQDQTLEFVDLDSGKALGDHRRTETLRLIEGHVGLSFDQFRRAVLLAQGDFALFLQAKGDERARLLEKITGTEIYARLSEGAFRRCKEERERLAALRAEAERYPILSDEERSAKEADRERLRLLREALTLQVERGKHAVDWHRARSRLRQELGEAEGAALEARGRWDAAAALREEIARCEGALALRPLLDGEGAAARRFRQAEEERAQAAGRLARAGEDCERGRLAEAQAEGALGALRARQAAQGPGARAGAGPRPAAGGGRGAAPRRGAGGGRGHRRPRGRAAARGRGRGAARSGRAAARRDRGVARGERSARDARRGLAPLAGGAARGRGGVAQALQPGGRARGPRDEARGRRRGGGAGAGTAGGGRPAAGRGPPGGPRGAGGLRRPRGGAPPGRPAGGAAAGRGSAGAAPRGAGGRRGAAAPRRVPRRGAGAGAGGRAARGPVPRGGGRGQGGAAPGAGGARRGGAGPLAAAGGAGSAARRPELLLAGHPCPLCGALEHPDADTPAPASAGVRRLQETHAALRQKVDELREQEAAARQEGHAHEALAAKARGRAGDLEAVRAGKAAALEAQLAALSLLADPAAVPLPSLEEATEAARLEAAGLTEAAAAGEELRRALAHRLEVQARAAEELERLTAEEAAALEARAAAERAAAVHRQEAQGAQERWRRAEGSLEGALALRPGWRQALASPEALEGALGAEVARWEEQTRRGAEQEEAARRLDGQLARCREALAGLAAGLAAREVSRGACAIEVAGLRRERAALLGGRSVEEAVAALADAARVAEGALGLARSQGAAAQQARAAAEEAARTAEHRHGALEGELREARTQLAAGAGAAGIEEEDLRRWLREEPSIHEGRRRQLTALREALAEADVRLDDRRRRLAEHEARDAQEAPAEACEAALAQGAGQLEAAANDLFHLQVTLEQDEQTRAQRTRVEADVTTLSADVEGWERLSELIGSADGKKFRQFAQSLTLDILLEHTNAHLRQLRPRYRIERVRGADMDLQVVDRDMGGEVRSCATLSGGESFLVSLALALGLSSLSSRDVRVESLFIDEGFGTLDRDTLEVAIAALEQLQAAGRQVGLISHVPDLADRIGYQVLVRPRHTGHSTVTISDGRR